MINVCVQNVEILESFRKIILRMLEKSIFKSTKLTFQDLWDKKSISYKMFKVRKSKKFQTKKQKNADF